MFPKMTLGQAWASNILNKNVLKPSNQKPINPSRPKAFIKPFETPQSLHCKVEQNKKPIVLAV